MSTFWLIYWIAIGVILVFVVFTIYFFDMKVRYEYEPVPIAYAILALLIGFVPGVGIIGSLAIISIIVAAIGEGDLKPKKNPFGKNDKEDE